MLCEISENGQIGGCVHILDFSSAKSTRVARSTYAAELLAATRGLERGELLQGWITEVFHGPCVFGARGSIDREPAIGIYAGVDARGLFDSLTARDIGKLTDKSMLIYCMAYREALRFRIVDLMFWLPTESMLADELTKEKDEISEDWWQLYHIGSWFPRCRPELTEDLVTFDTLTGLTSRWRMQEV
jgi:hypothetical protein